MKLRIPLLLLFQLVFIIVAQVATGLDLKINNQEIPEPLHYVKSKFREYIPIPELQDKLEIPIINPMQKTIRESFIPDKPPKPKRFGIRSFFRGEKHEDKVTSMSVNGDTKDPKAGVDSDEEDEPEDSLDKVKNNIEPIHSPKSWVKEFLIFKQSKKMSMMSVQEKNSLRTRIKNYDSTESNPYDLKKWVQLVSSDKSDDESNGITKKYSNHNNGINNNNNEIEIDIDEFIKYLVNEQGFNPADLQFLKTKNLDYGLGEIEKELNKVKDQKRNPKVIKIGGEEESLGNKIKVHSYFVIFLVVMIFG
ncbi:uncharacterized protein SPAPADRAFT_65943 [Spathaspora passalidarum NRRL Y-27907]|uniref:Uncharacterized protein n=1 Tax=Spathaspora passalidarum (strain NRRL Y-27907 / 11-Y1) TaxID=619300 RepID=G3AKG9_SPAPN|nr:uncharacterized protein SPAPADRAFT_65943 [Spathaspora passalidarum NRRL Y-27907]EGW32926.1 hypothetical protein SPAPADRAFT_65943 [Spathaspora passalidarum NRRL Y-27907]